MALVKMKELLDDAKKNNYAVGAFEFWSLDSIRAIIEAAEELNSPVILQAGATELNFMGWDGVSRAVPYLIENAKIKAALHLDHSTELKWVKMAVESGFSSVMIDASEMSFEKNVLITKETVEIAKPYGITVEAELGRLPGFEGAVSVEDAEAFQTDADEAARFVRETGIDCLAVAVGTAHGMYKTKPKLNIARIKEIAGAVDVPLVLHGGSGTPDEMVREAIKAGICKVNVCTEFMDAYRRSYLKGGHPSIRGLFEPAFFAGKEVIKEKIKLFGGIHE